MKKKFILILMVLVSVFTLTGCNNKNNDIQLITETKSEIENITSQIFKTYGSTKKINSEYFEDYFISLSYDMLTNLEEEYNKGTKIYVEYSTGEVNGMVTGVDQNDDTKYYIYVGSETYEDIWTYATVDLASEEISWQDNFQDGQMK